MARVRRGVKARRRRNRILKAASGYVGGRRRLFRTAKDQVDRSRAYAYRDRRQRKRLFRRLWIVRINAASRQHGVRYGDFIAGLKRANVGLDRRVLAHLAYAEPTAFAKLVEIAKGA